MSRAVGILKKVKATKMRWKNDNGIWCSYQEGKTDTGLQKIPFIFIADVTSFFFGPVL